MILTRLHTLCPMWRWHRDRTWNFLPIYRFHWFCKRCPLKQFNGVGRAYRITIGEEQE